LNTRKSVRNLSQEELARLRFAFNRMMGITDDRGYGALAGIHGLPLPISCKHGESEGMLDPNMRIFLPWHRAYLYWFELYLQDAASDFTISVPWWDWSSEISRLEGIPIAFTEEEISGSPNPLYKFRVHLSEGINFSAFTAATGCPKSITFDTHRESLSPTQLPTSGEVEGILSLNDYGDFSDGMENIHNSIHGWVGGRCGDMSYVPFAAFDPIFWVHHSMVDRLFWLWQLRPGHSVPTSLRSTVLQPFNLTVGDVLNIYELGYDYASQQILIGPGG
jgi:tyrosinase